MSSQLMCDNTPENDENQLVDPFTLEPIPEENRISFRVGKLTLCYDIVSLARGQRLNLITVPMFPDIRVNMTDEQAREFFHKARNAFAQTYVVRSAFNLTGTYFQDLDQAMEVCNQTPGAELYREAILPSDHPELYGILYPSVGPYVNIPIHTSPIAAEQNPANVPEDNNLIGFPALLLPDQDAFASVQDLLEAVPSPPPLVRQYADDEQLPFISPVLARMPALHSPHTPVASTPPQIVRRGMNRRLLPEDDEDEIPRGNRLFFSPERQDNDDEKKESY